MQGYLIFVKIPPCALIRVRTLIRDTRVYYNILPALLFTDKMITLPEDFISEKYTTITIQSWIWPSKIWNSLLMTLDECATFCEVTESFRDIEK